MSTFTVEHIDVATHRTFDETTALFLRHVPLADPAEIAAAKNGADLEAMMASRAGVLGILVMTKVEQGRVVSLLGTPMKLSTYLVGSPLLGVRLFTRHRGAGLYAPARVTIYEDTAAVAHFAYDRPSSFLAQFDDPEVATIGRAFDEKLASLSVALTAR